MNRQGRIPRSRGGICGVLLILLGVWGGLGPFVSPYFHFGYTPDKTWYYSTGRLYFSIIPGAAAVLGGLLVLATRHRGVGIFGGLLGVLSGAWFVTGTNFVADVLHRSVPFGVQIVPASLSGQALVLRGYLELVALFTGVGLLLLFAGALAMGRFSMIGARDLAADGADGYYTDFPAGQPPGQADAASPAGQYPPATQYPAPAQYPAATSYPTAAGQFPDSPSAFPDTTTAEFPPETTS
jgi:hypothetical protein